MPHQETSLTAYIVKVLPRLAEKQHEVYKVFARSFQPLTNMEAAALLGWSINRVTPRVLELREAGVLTFAEQRKCRVTGNTAMAWKTT